MTEHEDRLNRIFVLTDLLIRELQEAEKEADDHLEHLNAVDLLKEAKSFREKVSGIE